MKELKEKWYDEQKGICPVLKAKIPLNKVVMDHCHRKKSEPCSEETGKGLCRGAIDFRANALEGKITNNFKRLGLDKEYFLPEVLRNLADYLEFNHNSDEITYVHPSERPRKPKLSKRCYSTLQKKVQGKQRMPAYTGNLTKPLKKLFEKYKVEIKFNKLK